MEVMPVSVCDVRGQSPKSTPLECHPILGTFSGRLPMPALTDLLVGPAWASAMRTNQSVRAEKVSGLATANRRSSKAASVLAAAILFFISASALGQGPFDIWDRQGGLSNEL